MNSGLLQKELNLAWTQLQPSGDEIKVLVSKIIVYLFVGVVSEAVKIRKIQENFISKESR